MKFKVGMRVKLLPKVQSDRLFDRFGISRRDYDCLVNTVAKVVQVQDEWVRVQGSTPGISPWWWRGPFVEVIEDPDGNWIEEL